LGSSIERDEGEEVLECSLHAAWRLSAILDDAVAVTLSCRTRV
jgi:hypothetical protein